MLAGDICAQVLKNAPNISLTPKFLMYWSGSRTVHDS